MAEAFGRDNAQKLPACLGRRPHVRDLDPEGCEVEHVRPILQGASNSWFRAILSALSIPQATDKLAQLVESNWAMLVNAHSREILVGFRAINVLRKFSAYADAQVGQAIERKRLGGTSDASEPTDIKTPERRAFSDPASAPQTRHFRLRVVPPPENHAARFERIVLLERLREVKALVGFTRIESPRDFDTPFDLPPERRALKAGHVVCARRRNQRRGRLLRLLLAGGEGLAGQGRQARGRLAGRPRAMACHQEPGPG